MFSVSGLAETPDNTGSNSIGYCNAVHASDTATYCQAYCDPHDNFRLDYGICPDDSDLEAEVFVMWGCTPESPCDTICKKERREAAKQRSAEQRAKLDNSRYHVATMGRLLSTIV